MIADLPAPTTPAEVALAYMFTVDRRDFEAYRTLFGDTVEVHYEPSQPGVPKGEVDADDWVSGAEHTFTPIEATHHTVVPVSARTEGDTATVISNCTARHYDPEVAGGHTFEQFMIYSHHLRRDGDRWVIARVDAQVLYSTGNPGILAKAEQG